MVEVEFSLSAGVPTVVLVRMPDAVVRQSVDRVRAAVVNTGHDFPLRRVTIGLSPAAMPKQGSGFDLSTYRVGHFHDEPSRSHLHPHVQGPCGGRAGR